MKRKHVFYSYGYLLNAAQHANVRLKNGGEPLTESLNTILHCALALEAYLNHVGAGAMPCWTPLKKKLSPNEKVEVLAAHLGIPVDWGKMPYQSLAKAFAFRNLIVHAETETVELPVADTRSAEAKWQAYCKPKIADRVLADTWRFIKEFKGPDAVRQIPSFILAERTR